MPGTSHRARYALGSTVVALSLALLAGALPFFGGASADNTRELLRVSFRPVNAPPLDGWRSDHGEPYDSRRAYGWVRDNASGEPVSMTASATARSYAATRTDTFITMQPPSQKWGRWVMDVPNGTYRVTVTVGDRAAAAGSQTLAVEDERVVERFVPSASEPTRTETVDVEVTDGRITVDPLYPGPGGEGEARLGRGARRARRRARADHRAADHRAPDDGRAHHRAADHDHATDHDGAADDAAPDHAPAQRAAQPGRLRRRRQVPHATRTPRSGASSTAWPPPAAPGCASGSCGAPSSSPPASTTGRSSTRWSAGPATAA